jgi:hypothetical protein
MFKKFAFPHKKENKWHEIFANEESQTESITTPS